MDIAADWPLHCLGENKSLAFQHFISLKFIYSVSPGRLMSVFPYSSSSISPCTSFQYLYDSPGSDIPHLLTPDSDSDLLCDKVTVCPEPLVLEIHEPPPEVLPAPPLGLEPDSRSVYLWHDISSRVSFMFTCFHIYMAFSDSASTS